MAYHTFEALGQKMLYDPCTEAILQIDSVVYDLMQQKESNEQERIEALKARYDKKTLQDALQEIQTLIDDGILSASDREHEPLARPEPVIKALCLHVAHDCDLRCRYCFASQGDFKGNRELMSAETGKKALDFLVQNSGNRRNLEVDFFGGEPLLNFSVVKELTLYGEALNKKHNKNIRFTITTNGVALDDDKIDFINEHMSNVVMSLDGRKEVHDRMRPTRNQKGSYDTVLPKFKKLLASRGNKDSFIRGTFTGYNLDFDKDVLHFFDEGFTSVSMEPVVTDESLDYAIQKEDLEGIKQSYERLAKEFLQRKRENPALQFFHFMVDLTDGPCLAKKRMGCGAGVEYVSITPNGDIFPCHQFVGEKEFIIGNLEEGINNPALIETFKQANVDQKAACRDCWNQNFCSGGCHANAWFNNQDLMKPYENGCEMQKKRTELALGLHAAESLD